jgi:hypothetical protein
VRARKRHLKDAGTPSIFLSPASKNTTQATALGNRSKSKTMFEYPVVSLLVISTAL